MENVVFLHLLIENIFTYKAAFVVNLHTNQIFKQKSSSHYTYKILCFTKSEDQIVFMYIKLFLMVKKPTCIIFNVCFEGYGL